MRYIPFIGLLAVFLFLPLISTAQSGNYFMTRYNHFNKELDAQNFDIAQDSRGLICIANRRGVLFFDGKDWDLVKTPSAVYSILVDEKDNVIYTGTYAGFGIISILNNQYEYTALSDSSSQVGEIYKVIYHNQFLYGLSNNIVYVLDLNSNNVIELKSDYGGDIYNIFKIDDKLYASTANSGLQQIDGNTFKESNIDDFDQLQLEFVARHPSREEYLLGTSANKLFSYKEGSISVIEIEDQDNYLINSDFINGVWVNDTLATLTTLKGGVIFIDLKAKKIDQIINYQTGLPDNEILAFTKDSNDGIWVSHNSGLTRITPRLPFRSFHKYEGLEGTIISTANHNNQLYVGTSSGLYLLEKEGKYEAIEVVKKQTVIDNGPQTEEIVEEEAKKGGFLGLFKKKEESTEESKPVARKRTIYKKSITQKLKSISYKYKKLDNLKSKVFQFYSHNGRLYCAGIDGIFELIGNQTRAITTKPVHYFTVAEQSGLIIAATYDNQILSFELDGENKKVELFYDYKDRITFIFEERKNKIWFTSTDEIFNVEIDNGTIAGTEIFPIDNPYIYSTLGTLIDDKPTFINESGIFTINEGTRSKAVLDTTITGQYITGTNGQVWYYNNERWVKLGNDEFSQKLNLSSVFKNIKYISADSNDDYWVVTENNELYKLLAQNEAIATPYELYLKAIKSPNGTISYKEKFRFDQQNGAINFEFSQPEFSGILDIKYSYKLEGLNEEEWSLWSESYNIINFPYLPDGKYKLKVRSKNVLGEIKEIGPISFTIVPPYWKRPWFYILEFSALGLLLVISIRLKKLGFKYQLVSRLLALVILIIIIEFIQTVAENELSSDSSPVLDFLIQVSIAIIVLPVESMIRKFIFREKMHNYLTSLSLKKKANNLILLLLLFITACTTSTENKENEVDMLPANPAQPGFDSLGSDPEAIAWADAVMMAMGGRKNWDKLRYISWDFFGRRHLLWDKFTGNVRIEVPSDSIVYLLNINEMTGKARMKSRQITDADSLEMFLKTAQSIWINDSYWLVMPFKLKDTGVTLKYKGLQPLDSIMEAVVLELTFTDVGVTPKNKYQVYINPADSLVNQWAFFRDAVQESPDAIWPWDNYQKYGDIRLSANRSDDKGLGNVKVYDELPAEAFQNFDWNEY